MAENEDPVTGQTRVMNGPGSDEFTDLVRVRHHTSSEGLSGKRKSGYINASRGAPYGVDVEVAPFVESSKVNLGQAAGGAKGGGGYVEFSIPRSQLNLNYRIGGTGTAGRIVTGGSPLNLNGTNPSFVNNWKFW